MNASTSSTDQRPVTDALTNAATQAVRYAPSVLNTQPWRWRVHPERLELFADRSRQLTAMDPDGRLLALSCGVALDHVRVSLAGQGWAAQVDRTSDSPTPGLLATLTAFDRIEITPKAQHQAHAIRTRYTDRRPVSEQPLAAAVIRAVATSAGGRIRLHILSSDQVLDLSAAASRAITVAAKDSFACAELEYWTSRRMPDGAGLPAAVLPDRCPQTTVPGRCFGHPGTLPVGSGHDRAATYALLYGEQDDPASWLEAGEALSSVWLTATTLNVSVLPLSDVVSVPATREALRRMLRALDHPYLALRLGIAEPQAGTPPRTPRLPAAQLIETVPRRACHTESG